MWRFNPPSESNNDANWNEKFRQAREEKDRQDAMRYRTFNGDDREAASGESRGRYISLDGSRSSW